MLLSTASPPKPPRLLLCADAGHCAQVLAAAAPNRVALHGLEPCTQWPSAVPAGTVVLWALVPEIKKIATRALEEQWRIRMMQGSLSVTIHMLYGHAAQQAEQLTPWLTSSESSDTPDDSAAHCWECLDGRSEQALFQHLLQQTATHSR